MSDGKLFVGGLSWETTEDGLRAHFSQYGEIMDCVVMREPATGRSRGFGFVTYHDSVAVDKVLEERKHTLDGKTVDPKRAVPRDQISSNPPMRSGPPASAASHASDGTITSSGELRTRKIFVGGIAHSTNEDVLRDYFSKYGNVEDVMLMVDKETRKPRGFAFVTFDSEDAVEDAVQKNMHEIDNKQNVEVKKAEPKGFRPPMGGGVRGGGPFAMPYGDPSAYGAFGAGYGGIIPSQVRPPGGYGVPYTATPYDAFASSLYTGGPGSIGYGGAPTASGGSRSSSLAVPYAGQSYPGYPPGGYTGYGSDNLAPVNAGAAPPNASRSPAPYGAIGTGYQDGYYGGADSGSEYAVDYQQSAQGQGVQGNTAPSYAGGPVPAARPSPRFQPYGRS